MKILLERILLNTFILILQTGFQVYPIDILCHFLIFIPLFYWIVCTPYSYSFLDPLIWFIIHQTQMDESYVSVVFLAKVLSLISIACLKETLKNNSVLRFFVFMFLVGTTALAEIGLSGESAFYSIPAFLMCIFLYLYGMNVLERSHFRLRKIMNSEGSTRSKF